MKLRLAKKIGKSDRRRRRGTEMRAFNRWWKFDVRQNGIPGNLDCWMAMVHGMPGFGWDSEWDAARPLHRLASGRVYPSSVEIDAESVLRAYHRLSN